MESVRGSDSAAKPRQACLHIGMTIISAVACPALIKYLEPPVDPLIYSVITDSVDLVQNVLVNGKGRQRLV